MLRLAENFEVHAVDLRGQGPPRGPRRYTLDPAQPADVPPQSRGDVPQKFKEVDPEGGSGLVHRYGNIRLSP